MFQSIIIVDPKSEIKGKQDANTYVVRPTVIDRRESIRIKDIQTMLSWCAKSAFQGEHKRVVIEQLHKSSDAVPHALLKLLEEPPQYTQIVLTIDRPESALPTIRSRCAIMMVADLDENQMNNLGLERSLIPPQLSGITWSDFLAKDRAGRMEWVSSFVKSKKDCHVLIEGWQHELALSLRQEAASNSASQLKQLGLLEEVAASLRQNVLPRLALVYLCLRLDKA